MHTKLGDSSFSRSRDISGGVKFYNPSRDSDHVHLWDSWPSESVKGGTSRGQTVHSI